MSLDLSAPAWGIAARDGLWPTTIRILFVIDGRIELHKDEALFGLGYVLETIRASWSWWVRFEVDIATREETISDFSRDSHEVAYAGFRFNSDGFDIDAYDQVWFFADQPNKTDGSDATTDADIVPPYTLDDAELRILAEWMDRGGGVFATGDHHVLGASLCSRIPRVRTMRKWTQAQGAPSVAGPRRHQTLQGGDDFAGEGDLQLQPVELVYWQTAHALPFLQTYRPHAVMCSNWGPIDRFPDHMHEGEVIADELVELDRPLNIPGYDRPEYPYPVPEVLASGLFDAGELRWRPRPQVVAFGRTTNPYYPESVVPTDPPATLAFARTLLHPGRTKSFGLVSVYDGDAANLGRVVCDSTWHHWLSVNLTGIAEGGDPAYRKMQAYYRNIGAWLATPAQRQSMLVAGVWGALIGSAPMRFAARQSEWEMGELGVEVLSNTMSPCWIDEVVSSFLDLQTVALRYVAGKRPKSDPVWTSLPVEVVTRAVVGSLCKALFDVAQEHRKALGAQDRVGVDVPSIQRLAARGAIRARELLRSTVDDAVKSFGALRDTLAGTELLRPVETSKYERKGT